MNSYNIAVTVGPNIFRPKELTPADFVNAGTFYDIMIRFMENFDEIFGGYNYVDDKKAEEMGLNTDMMAQVMEVENDDEQEPEQPVQREIRQKAVPRTVNHKTVQDTKALNRAVNREEGIVYDQESNAASKGDSGGHGVKLSQS